MGYMDYKEKKAHKVEGNGKYTTTAKDLKHFAKQVEDKQFGDKKFEKAYSAFKTPVYGMKEE